MSFADAFDTPLGSALMVVDAEDRLVQLELLGRRAPDPERLAARRGFTLSGKRCKPFVRQVQQYLRGRRKSFEIPLSPRGTAFQQAVWEALREIPYGATASYAEIARRIDRPTATRAVGRANGANPIWIVIPCHRVIGSSGALTGYGGGIPVKRALLELEGAPLEPLFQRRRA